ncbi:MAG: flippase [Nanoarchaeota archaeon]|nr:flippase [Nanoarchaeota archaeon]
MNLKQELMRNNSIVMGSGLVVAAISFVFNIVLARWLQPIEFGLYSLALTIVGIFIIFTNFGIGQTAIRYLAHYIEAGRYGSAKALLLQLLKYRVVLLVLIGFLLIFLPDSIAAIIFQKPEATFIVFLSGFLLMIHSLEEFLQTILNGFKEFFGVSAMMIIKKIGESIFALSFVAAGWHVFGAVLGLFLASILSIFVSLRYFLKQKNVLQARAQPFERESIARFGVWASFLTIVVVLFTMSDQFLVSIFADVEDIGFYRIAITWTAAISTLFPVSATVLYPYFSGNKEAIRKRIFSNAIRYASIFSFPLAFLLSAYSGSIIASFYGISYISAASVLQILSLSAIPVLFSTILFYYFSGVNEPGVPTKITGSILVLHITLVIVLLSQFGIVGAAIGTVISRCVEALVMAFAAKKRHNLPFHPAIFLKPLLAITIVYVLVLQLTITSIAELVLYGIGSLALYLGILYAFRGFSKNDFIIVWDIIRRR